MHLHINVGWMHGWMDMCFSLSLSLCPVLRGIEGVSSPEPGGSVQLLQGLQGSSETTVNSPEDNGLLSLSLFLCLAVS